MKKKLKIISLFLCISLTLGVLPLVSNAQRVEPMPSEILSYLDVTNQIKQNKDNIELHYIGKNDSSRFELSTITDISVIEDISLNTLRATKKTNENELKLLYICENQIDSAKENSSVRQALDKGYLVYFEAQDHEDVDEIFSVLTGYDVNTQEIASDESESTHVINACFVAKNLNGEYYTGTLYISQNSPQDAKDEQILVNAWQDRNLHYYTKNDSSLTSALTKEVLSSKSPSIADSFTISDSWKVLSSWHKNTWTEAASGFYNEFSLSEWICFLGVRSGGKDYYAWCVESYATPNSNVFVNPNNRPIQYNGTSSVIYGNDANLMQNNALLFSYSPNTTPSSSSVSVSLGGDISNQLSLGISASYEIVYNDLVIYDLGNMGQEESCISFTYPLTWTGNLTNYSLQQTKNCYAVIIQNPTNSSTYKFHHARGMAVRSNWTLNTTKSMVKEYYTTINRPPAST